MEVVLWQVLAGTRGGPNRVRVLRALDRRPRNANQLAEELDLSYKTIRHHLDVLEENQLVKSSDGDYGVVYMPSEKVTQYRETIDEIMEQVSEEDDDTT
jgi:DNA-binding transcriptional ArsR family regulator